jgi:hypothetical protein
MARVTTYKNYVKDILSEYAALKPSYGDVDVEMIADEKNHHYEVVTVGWDGFERVHGCLLHVDIKDDKIWIQHDGTEEGIANRLVELGVPKSDIVLGFHAPYKRKFTDYAIG